jgi:hypothetical protein
MMHLRAFSCLQVIAPAGGLKGACAELFPNVARQTNRAASVITEAGMVELTSRNLSHETPPPMPDGVSCDDSYRIPVRTV